MLRLMLLRHAKSDWSAPGLPDHERTLNARGSAVAPLVGQYLAREKLLPSLILCSTAVRTRETCALVTAELPSQPPVHYEPRLYESDHQTIIKVIAATPPDMHNLLVVGHNPGLQLTTLSLAVGGHAKQRAKLREKFPTAALAVITFDIKTWNDITTRGGMLERFVAPRDMPRAD